MRGRSGFHRLYKLQGLHVPHPCFVGGYGRRTHCERSNSLTDVDAAACAIYLADEEVCVAMGRFFAKVNQLDSDAYRMFAALCRLCQSPASWYNSGPVQKYILRQIRVIDDSQLRVTQPGLQTTGPVDLSEMQGETRNLDVTLLMLYGHILFTSTSYTFALSTATL